MSSQGSVISSFRDVWSYFEKEEPTRRKGSILFKEKGRKMFSKVKTEQMTVRLLKWKTPTCTNEKKKKSEIK